MERGSRGERRKIDGGVGEEATKRKGEQEEVLAESSRGLADGGNLIRRRGETELTAGLKDRIRREGERRSEGN